MRKKRLIILLLLTGLFLAMPAGAALAAPVFTTVVADGDTIDNDVVLFDDDLEVNTGAIINGDVTIFNGDALIAGTVNGDVVIFDGNLSLTETGDLNGDCVLLDGTLENESGRSVSCTQLDNIVPPAIAAMIDDAVQSGDIPRSIEVDRPDHSPFGHFLGGVAETVAQTLVLGLLAFIVAAAAPQQMQRVATAARQKPVASGFVGTATAVAAPFVLVILALLSAVLILACGLGLLGFPVLIALVIALGAGGIFGWIALGSIAGEKMAEWLNLQNRSLTVTTVVGTMTLTLVLGLLGTIPFFIGEGLLSMLLIWLGLGAVALTRFGTQMYPPLVAGSGKVPAPPEPDPDKVQSILDTLPDKADEE